MYNYFFCKKNKTLAFAEISKDDSRYLELLNSESYILKETAEKLNLKNTFFLDDKGDLQEINVEFEKQKQEKLKSLKTDFNLSKKITIQNGTTLVIAHDTPERDIFLNKLTAVLQESTLSNVSISYQQKVNNSMYIFSALPTVWSYVFKDLFLVDRKKSDGTVTGFKENSREYNKITFNAVVLKIQNATTIEELNAISWNFANPNGIFINVNEKAEQMLNDSIVDDLTKSAINQLKDPETGEIHLINIV